MKALSIRQPWAYAILHLGKDVENRRWATSFRGRFLIHASKTLDRESYEELAEEFSMAPIESLARGVIVGEALLTQCVRAWPSRWFEGPFGFVVRNVVQYAKPIAYPGQLGFFDVPDGLITSVME